MLSPGHSPSRSPRNLTKAEQIKEAALERVPCMTPKSPVVQTPGHDAAPHSPKQDAPMASRAEMLASAFSYIPRPIDGLVGADDDFDAPVEATPMTALAAHAQAPPDTERVLAPPPSDAPTSLHTKEPDVVPFDSAEFEEWMKSLTLGQKMRVRERMAVRNAMSRADEAIQTLSDAEEHSYEVWEAASLWQLGYIRLDETERYLSIYGFKLADALHWKDEPCVDGPQLAMSVDQHISRAGHTWYIIKCTLSGLQNGVDCISWQAPRRLGQLRLDLHDRVKDSLEIEIYDREFQHSRFAKFGGPPGTTARLNAWLGVLADIINKGVAQPSIATLALVFFSAPLPDGVASPAVEKGFLRVAGNVPSKLDNHSELGESNLGS